MNQSNRPTTSPGICIPNLYFFTKEDIFGTSRVLLHLQSSYYPISSTGQESVYVMLNHLAIYPKAISARMTRPSLLLPQQTYIRKLDNVRPQPAIKRLPYSTGGYVDGDNKGDPQDKNPASQGVSPRTRELEHPGPSPPDTRSAKSKSSDASKSSSSKPTKGNGENIPPRSSKEELNNEKKRQGKQG